MLIGKITRIVTEKEYGKLESDNGKEYTKN